MTPLSPSSSPVVPERRTRYELGFLDGLRAFAALYVVLHHAYSKPIADKSLWPNGIVQMPEWASGLAYGNFAVDVFIVLSGFLLALPVASSLKGTLDGGIGKYFQRRAKRILPPYYAALIFSYLIMVGGTLLSRQIGANRDMRADLSVGSVVTHILLIHSLFPAWQKLINAALWSVSTEWLIYFVFPLALLPVWRRFGIWAALVTGLILGIVPNLLGYPWANSAKSWLLCLFSMGMVGAALFVQGQQREATQDIQDTGEAKRRAWGVTGLVLAAVVVGFLLLRPVWYEAYQWQVDLLVGGITVCLILFCAPVAVRREAPRPVLLSLMESRVAKGIGHFSYSLYLIHSPLLALLYLVVRRLHLSVNGSLLVMMVVGMPISLGCAYLFYLAFEKPFLTKRSRAALPQPPAPTAISSPASAGDVQQAA